jgi:phosphoglucomutase
MADKVAKMNGVYIEDTFTGFKFMAEKIKEFEDSGKYKAIFSYEESYGYLIGDFVRDKDAVTASMLTAEMAAFYHQSGMTLYDAMEALYKKYGYFTEKTIYISMAGFDGLEKTAALMKRLRENTPLEIGGYKVLRISDYLSGTVLDTASGKTWKSKLIGSDTMYFELEGNACFIVRPSGTEPKVKVYVMAEDTSRAACDEKAAKIGAFAEKL